MVWASSLWQKEREKKGAYIKKMGQGFIPRELLVVGSKWNIYYEYVGFWCEIIVENYWIFFSNFSCKIVLGDI